MFSSLTTIKLNTFSCFITLKQFLLVVLLYCFDHDWLIWLSSRKLDSESDRAFLHLKIWPLLSFFWLWAAASCNCSVGPELFYICLLIYFLFFWANLSRDMSMENKNCNVNTSVRCVLRGPANILANWGKKIAIFIIFWK